MKNSLIFPIAIFGLLSASSAIHGMDQEPNPYTIVSYHTEKNSHPVPQWELRNVTPHSDEQSDQKKILDIFLFDGNSPHTVLKRIVLYLSNTATAFNWRNLCCAANAIEQNQQPNHNARQEEYGIELKKNNGSETLFVKVNLKNSDLRKKIWQSLSAAPSQSSTTDRLISFWIACELFGITPERLCMFTGAAALLGLFMVYSNSHR